MILTMSSKKAFHPFSHIQNRSFWSRLQVFCTAALFSTLSADLQQIVSSLSTKYFEKWSQSDFTDL